MIRHAGSDLDHGGSGPSGGRFHRVCALFVARASSIGPQHTSLEKRQVFLAHDLVQQIRLLPRLTEQALRPVIAAFEHAQPVEYHYSG